MKINLVGAGIGVGINSHLASLLMRYCGIEAHVNSINVDYFDVHVFCGLWNLDYQAKFGHDFFRKPCIALAIGSDVYRDLPKYIEKPDFRENLAKCKTVLMADEAMRPYLEKHDVKLEFWHIPIDTDLFHQGYQDIIKEEAKRDVLLYSAAPNHQDLDRILNYVRDHPNKKCTLIGRGYQDLMMEEYDNLLSIRYVPYECMDYLYAMHREYRLYIKRDVDLIGKMTCEALYMGLKAFSNDVEIKEIPDYMLPDKAMPRFVKILEEAMK